MNGFPLASGAPEPTTVVQVADTVLALPGRDGFDIIFGVTAGIIGLTFLAVLLALLFLFLQARKVARAVETGKTRFARDRGVEHLRRTAENIEGISRTLRDEMEKVRGAGDEVSDRLTQVSDRMEERIEEFNALMEVIQEEAEEVFLDTASTARGVRRGLGRLADGRRRPGRRADARRLARERLRLEKAREGGEEAGRSTADEAAAGELPDTQVSAPGDRGGSPPREQAGSEKPPQR